MLVKNYSYITIFLMSTVHFKNHTNILVIRNAEDYDPEDEDALQDEEFNDENFLSDIASLISNLFKVFKSQIVPFFEQLLPKLSEFLASQDSSARQWALCVFCDLIEFAGQSSVNYQQYFLNGMGSGLSDPSPDVRQAASYGVGVAAKYGGPSYSAFCMASLPHLFTIVSDPASRAEENVMATENAIAAIAKIISANKAVVGFPMNEVVTNWIKGLPLVNDADEAFDTYSLLLELLQSGHPSIRDHSTLKQIASALAQALSSNVLRNHEQLSARLQNSLKELFAGFDSTTKSAIAQMLDESQRNYLTSNGLV